MRTKEALDRQSKEDQERAWIYMLHNQAPPLTRRGVLASPPTEALSGFIPLAPLAAHAPSPLVAARAAAASLALHVNVNASAAPAVSGTWGTQSQRGSAPVASRDHSVGLPGSTPSAFDGMVKLDKLELSSTSASSHKTPLLSPLAARPAPSSSSVFRSTIPSASAVPEAPTPSAHVHRTPSAGMNSALVGVLPKAKRARDADLVEESYPRRASVVEEDCEYDSSDEARARTSTNGKRACLPKKCDFPMCKNSSRSRGFCYSHGGGRRCRIEGCANGAVSRDLCKRHGGGRRCRISGCKSSSESGGLCYSHGGGRRCNLSWCNARAKKGGYCAAHVDNRNALPPVDVVENERAENDKEEAAAAALKAPVKIAAQPTVAVEASVNPQVVETLLMLSKSPSQSEAEDNTSDASTTLSGSDLLSPRLSNPYAIASILN